MEILHFSIPCPHATPAESEVCRQGFHRSPRSGCQDLVRRPIHDIAKHFNELTASLIATTTANLHQSRTLAAQRDTLLPKLLSGELSVAEAALEV